MIYKYLRYFIFSWMFLFAMNSLAEGKWHNSTIKRVYPTADGGFVLTFTNSSPDCPANSAEKYHYVKDGNNGMTKEGANKIYSLALAAAAQDIPVNFYFDNGTADCFINRMYVDFD